MTVADAFIGDKFHHWQRRGRLRQRYNLIVFISADDLICFTVVHEVTMSLWTAQLSDDQITRLRGSQSITLSSPVMFKNLASEVIKGKGKILAPTGRKQTEVTLVVSLSKDLKVVQTLSVQCQRQPGADGLLTMFTKPMIQIIQHKRRDSLSSGGQRDYRLPAAGSHDRRSRKHAFSRTTSRPTNLH